jgi:hypothetical protein
LTGDTQFQNFDGVGHCASLLPKRAGVRAFLID